MTLYLTRFSYTPETWARLSQQPEDRRAAACTYIEAVGGKLHGFWYAFGEYDAYNLWEAPDNVSMAAVALAISGGGALSKYETTVLLAYGRGDDAGDGARPGDPDPAPRGRDGSEERVLMVGSRAATLGIRSLSPRSCRRAARRLSTVERTIMTAVSASVPTAMVDSAVSRVSAVVRTPTSRAGSPAPR